MKIAFLHMTMGLVNRGSEVTTDLLCNALSQNHEILCIQSGQISKKAYKVKQGLSFTYSSSHFTKNFFDKILFRLKLDEESGAVAEFSRACVPLLKEFDPDIIVATNGSLQLKVLKGESLRAKIVCFGHAGIGHHDKDTLLAKPDLFVALSQVADTWAKKLALSHTKVVYIPNPVVKDKASKINLGLTSPVVLSVGALSSYKNILSVVEASRLAGTSLLIIGDGEESSALESALSTYPHEFRWIKQVEPSDISSYYVSCDVFCFVPDAQEAFGRVYIEAMAGGLPIVASDDPIRRSIVGHQGLFVDPSDHEAIAGAITKASTMGKQDYKEELRPFDLSTVVSQLEKEFHDLIK
jgi:glycosyltransferase involved in cell wall biosynthesis